MNSIPGCAVAGTSEETSGGPADENEGREPHETLENAVLARLGPEGIASTGSWQQRKSARTRIAILEAAIKCLAKKGYARTTTKIVASMADVSRGAMLHHYPTKKDLIEQTIAYAYFKRMERTFGDIRNLGEHERQDEMAGVRLYQKRQNTPEYRACLELCMAARSNEKLRAILQPKAAEFEKVLVAELPRILPEWGGNPAQLIAANDFVIAAMDGLLINAVRWRDSDRAETVRKLVGRIIRLLNRGDIQVDDL